MFIDGELLFSDAQALTSASPVISSNTVDMGVAQRRLGTGNNLFVVSIVDTAFTDSGSTSYATVGLFSDSAVAFNVAEVEDQSLFVIPALSAIGAKFIAKIAPGKPTKRYIRLKYTMTNGDLTTGAATTFITDSVDDTYHYADARTLDPQ
jgi:hypothetical protein